MIKAVFFDNNGTIFDDLDVAFGSVVKIFETYNLRPPTKDQYRQEISADFMKFYCNHGFFSYSSEQENRTLAGALNRIREAYYLEHGHKACFRPDVARTIFELKKMDIKTAIVSAEKESMLFRQLDRFGFNGVFDPIFADVKDKQKCFDEICRELRISPQSAMYVDDTVDGTSAAKRAGLITVGMAAHGAYNSPERLKQVTSYLIDDLWSVVGLVLDFNSMWK